jgi:GTP pyrophosphokinase
VPLSARFDQALAWAAALHREQVRKGTRVPYVAHLMAVGSLALEHGASEDEAIAAVLHDAVEDQGGAATDEAIRQRFGPAVADIVAGCTDTDQTPKPPWRARKEAYILRLASATPSVRLVSLCDKLHNARSILADYRTAGESVWTRFNGGKGGTLWYYRALVEAYRAHGASPLLAELERVVREIERLAAEDCTCFEPESFRDDFERTVLGLDRTRGHALAEVSLDRCRRCGRLWLHYFVEYPDVADSSRWYRAPITPDAAQEVTPQRALDLLESLPWRVQGGAYFGRRAQRTSGHVVVDP